MKLKGLSFTKIGIIMVGIWLLSNILTILCAFVGESTLGIPLVAFQFFIGRPLFYIGLGLIVFDIIRRQFPKNKIMSLNKKGEVELSNLDIKILKYLEENYYKINISACAEALNIPPDQVMESIRRLKKGGYLNVGDDILFE